MTAEQARQRATRAKSYGEIISYISHRAENRCFDATFSRQELTDEVIEQLKTDGFIVTSADSNNNFTVKW